jgi:hypothetical protein
VFDVKPIPDEAITKLFSVPECFDLKVRLVVSKNNAYCELSGPFSKMKPF